MTGFMVWAYISANVDVTRDVVYAKAGTVELKADVYAPANPTSTKQPWVVVIHGGSWMMGQRQDMAQFAEALALQGVVGITISYRLAPANKWPAMLEDSQGAVRYFKQNAGKYGLDPERVGAAGASAGGHLAMFPRRRLPMRRYAALSRASRQRSGSWIPSSRARASKRSKRSVSRLTRTATRR